MKILETIYYLCPVIRKLKYLLFCLAMLLTAFLAQRCANAVAPTGGPKDETPPKVVAAVRQILTDPTEKAKLKKEFKSQTQSGSLCGYAMHKLNDQYDSNGDAI